MTLIGKKVTITDSPNPSLKGIKGEVINETKNMLIIRTNTKTITVIKNAVKIKTQ